MSLSSTLNINTGFLGFIALGTGVPAVALVLFNAPDMICQGLGVPYDKWKSSKESAFGLYMYTVSDIALAGLCILACLSPKEQVWSPATTTLTAVAVHQVSYLSSSMAVFGFRNDHIPCIITALISAGMAYFTSTTTTTAKSS
mmetsp:Transcript_9505/g.26263  ORF Transcript_9505/g.26263 Transcript_9505/m.26263 type:complete len:143 (-) Transcript_9505:1987-2415(-)